MNGTRLTKKLFTLILLFCAIFASGQGQNITFVKGGQFKDYILPMPIINGLESDGIWGNNNVVPRDKDNGIEDNIWCYWGGNPILGKDGNYHIAICRWKENTGHHGWFESEVAHCFSDNPFGPYQVTKTIVKKGHNPEVMKMKDGTYVLHVMDSRVFTSNNMTGPWKKIGSMRLDSRGFKPTNRFGSNLTSEYRPDGSIIVMKKDGDITISHKGILGPFQMMSINNYTRSTGYPEDPVIWRSLHQYHSIYNHAQDRKSGYMRSLDGVHWKNEEGLPYDASNTFYTNGVKNTWYKFERPKVIQDHLGRATHLSLAVMDVSKSNEKANDNHSSKNMIMPLLVERQVSILNNKKINYKTKQIKVQIKAEAGFDPQTDIDLNSLRIGSDHLVNIGKGCSVTEVKNNGKNLELTFKGENGINPYDFDFKLLGKTKSGDILYGYAILPGRSIEEASLIALPLSIKTKDNRTTLHCKIENCGLTESKPVKAEIRVYTNKGMKVLKRIDVSGLQPYKQKDIVLDVDKAIDCEYEVVITEDQYCDELWVKEDDTSSSVKFTGNWKEQRDSLCFLNKERVSTTLGDAVEFSFTGTRAKVYGKLGRKFGSFKVYLDEDYIETIRCNFAPVSQSPIYKTGILNSGRHILKMVKTDTQYNGKVTIDGFAVEKM